MKIQSLLLLLLLSKTTFSQTLLSSKVTDEVTKEDLIGASLKIMQEGERVKGAITDFNGEYRTPLNPGVYSVEVSYTGYNSSKTVSVKVLRNINNYLDFRMIPDSNFGKNPIIVFMIPLIRQDTGEHNSALISYQIKNLPSRPAQPIVSNSTQTQPPPPQPPTKKKKKPRQPSTGNKD